MSGGITPTGVLNNAEHIEAAQAEVTRLKEEHRALLSSEENARLCVIEDAVRMLEQASIPFCLYADSTPVAESTERSLFWQYNKAGYEQDWEEMMEKAQPRLGQLIEAQLRTLSRMAHGTFIWFSSDDKPRLAARGGQSHWVADSEGNDNPDAAV